MSEKSMLLRNLSAIAFSLYDLHLFLNTHPYDTNAIKLFTQLKQKYMVVAAEYERRYGPLTAANGVSGSKWKWVNSPWPWEYSFNSEV